MENRSRSFSISSGAHSEFCDKHSVSDGSTKDSRKLSPSPLCENPQVLSSTSTPDGVPTWAIVDQAWNQFFQIEWSAFQLLSQWQAATAEGLVDLVTRTTSAKVSTGNVMELVQFLYRNNLTRDSLAGGS